MRIEIINLVQHIFNKLELHSNLLNVFDRTQKKKNVY